MAMAAALVLAGYDYAFAYIDPGSGSYFLQWLLAGLLAAAFALRMFWRNVVAYVGRLLGRNKDTARPEKGDSSN
jgi:hypothetical protein